MVAQRKLKALLFAALLSFSGGAIIGAHIYQLSKNPCTATQTQQSCENYTPTAVGMLPGLLVFSPVFVANRIENQGLILSPCSITNAINNKSPPQSCFV